MGKRADMTEDSISTIVSEGAQACCEGARAKDADNAVAGNGADQNDTLYAVAWCLMELVAAALNESSYDAPLPATVGWGDLFRLACRHGLDSAAWYGLKERDDVPSGVRAAWEHRMQLAFFRCVRMDVEQEALFSELDHAGIAYMPLRGSIIASYYPRPEMRTMSDRDFLYGFVEPDVSGGFRLCGATERERDAEMRRAMRALRDIMVQRGYSAEQLGHGNHDTYHKEPCYNFEPHRRLVAPDGAYGTYYQNPWRFAHHAGQGRCRFVMDASDEYVYTIVHAHKHVMDSGLGLRILADVSVFWRTRVEELDEGRIRRELEELGIERFECVLRALAGKLLPSVTAAADVTCDRAGRLTCEEEGLFAYLTSSGAHGSLDNLVANRLRGMAGSKAQGVIPASDKSRVSTATRLGYTLRRLFGVDALKGRRLPDMPVIVVERLIRAMGVRRKEVLRELRLIWRR